MSRPSCPDWAALAANGAEGEAWDEALRHLDDCPHCGDDALVAEPTLLFRSLPDVPAEAIDVESMKQGVAALRRAREMPAISTWSSRRRSLLRAAAVAVVLLGGLLVQGGAAGPSSEVEMPIAGMPIAVMPITGTPITEIPVTATLDAARGVQSETALEGDARIGGFTTVGLEAPLIEDHDPDAGPVIQLVDGDMSVLVVVADAHFDV